MKQHQRVAAMSKCSIIMYKNIRNANYLNFGTKLDWVLTSNTVFLFKRIRGKVEGLGGGGV